MFEFVRSHTKLLQLLLLVLILPSFVVFGIQGYTRFSEGNQQNVASVDGSGITQGEWDAAHQQQVTRVRSQFPNVDAKMFDTPQARAETLEGLVRERVLRVAAQRTHLAVTDERLQRLFVSDPQFATIRNADGSVNKELLAAQGMTSEVFAARLRQDLTVQQVMRGVAETATAPASIVGAAFDALLQRRAVRYARFELKDYLGKVAPTEAEVEAHYKSHEADYRAPEQATIEYVVLDLDALKKGVAVPDEDLRRYYTENAPRYTSAEERRARHILIEAEKAAAPDVRQKARAQAEAVLAEVRKNPAAFADLARKHSQDPGSAGKGGDLDFFGRGAMTKPFEDAAFAMKAGEISNVVESDYGYHIIKLEAVRGGEKQAFEAVRAGIEDEVRRQLAQKRWAEAAEQFTNTVYEQSDNLQPAVDKFKLEKRSAVVQRTPAPQAQGPLASAKLLEAVFASDSVRNKRNTDAVEVGPSQLASARVVEHQPARTRPLAEVKERVLEQLRQAQAAALAQKDGEARLAQLRSDGRGDLPLAATVSRARAEGLPRAALDAVLRADAAKLPAFVGVAVPGQGYVVAAVDSVMARDTAADDMPRMREQYARVWAQAEAEAYYNALRARYKVELSAPKPDAAAAAASAPKN